ncbi:MAG: hypothetical protein BV456_06735 [Thermoplasmata archaeon M8B2D]|nr:MAG: hypothetical protein BV456_06735 [Thermoplasmata archaeon M8B2D]
MTITIKKHIGDAGAGMDQSHGSATLYDAVKAIATQVAALTTAFNQLLTDYNAETDADHDTSGASSVDTEFTIE